MERIIMSTPLVVKEPLRTVRKPVNTSNYGPRLHNLLKPVPNSVIIEHFTPLSQCSPAKSRTGDEISSLLATLPISKKREAYNLAWQLRKHYNHPANPDLHGVYKIRNIEISGDETIIETINGDTVKLVLSYPQKRNLLNMWNVAPNESFVLFHHGWYITVSSSEYALQNAHKVYRVPFLLTSEEKQEFLNSTTVNSNMSVLENRLQDLIARRAWLKSEKLKIQTIFQDAYNNGATRWELANIMGKMESFLNTMRLEVPENPVLPDLDELTRIWEEYRNKTSSQGEIQSKINVLTSVLSGISKTKRAGKNLLPFKGSTVADIETWYEYAKQRKIDYTAQAYINGVKPGVINATQPGNSPYFTPIICYGLTVDNPDENIGEKAVRRLEDETFKYVNSKILLSGLWVETTRNW